MNRKAVSWGVMLSLIIAVALVALLFFGPLKGIVIDKIFPIAENLPGFENTAKDPTVFGQVRYDIINDKVEIYDGERWNLFGNAKEFPIFEEPLTETALKTTFSEYYFSRANRDTQAVLHSFDNNIVRGSRVLKEREQPTFGFIERNGIVLEVWETQNGELRQIKDSFIFVEANGKVSDTITTGQSVQWTVEMLEEIAPKAITWRSSVVKKPITIDGIDFCVTLIDNVYLNVDLNKPGACNEQ